MKELDGGQLDNPLLLRSEAVQQICEDFDIGRHSIQEAPTSMIETLQDAAYQQMQKQVSRQAEESADVSTQLPDAQEQACRYHKECKGKKKQCRKKFRALIVEPRPSGHRGPKS